SSSDFELLAKYADALVLAGQTAEAERSLEAGWGLLAAAGDARAPVHLRLAELRLAAGDYSRARQLLEPLLVAPQETVGADGGRFVRLLISLGESTEAQRQLVALPAAREPHEVAELALTRGWISAWRGDVGMAE